MVSKMSKNNNLSMFEYVCVDFVRHAGENTAQMFKRLISERLEVRRNAGDERTRFVVVSELAILSKMAFELSTSFDWDLSPNSRGRNWAVLEFCDNCGQNGGFCKSGLIIECGRFGEIENVYID
jgi:hypothetical protein